MPKPSIVILTVIDTPNDNYTFVAESPLLAEYGINPEFLKSKDIVRILSGLDTCGDNVYLGALEVRYFDGVNFVVRNYHTDYTYQQITGCVDLV